MTTQQQKSKKNSSQQKTSKALKQAPKKIRAAVHKKKVEKKIAPKGKIFKKSSKVSSQKLISSLSTGKTKLSKKVSKISLQAKNVKKVSSSTSRITSKLASTNKKKKSAPAPLVFTQVQRSPLQQQFVTQPLKRKGKKLDPFLEKQRQRLLQLKDMLLDSMSGVARGNLRSGCDTSAFGMHQADAGSDACDRDFALSILSQEQNSLYEIDEALKRIDDGTYGICEISGKTIPRARLEARPFTRYTVECQADLEKRQHFSGARLPLSALFGATEEESENEEEQEEEEGFVDIAKD